MFEYIIEKIKANNYDDIKGGFSCKIPFSIDVINALLNKAEDTKDSIKNLEVIAINGDEITFKMTLGGIRLAPGFDIVDRELVLKIHSILVAPEWLLKIEILDGIKRIENEILEILFNTWFKNNLVDFENRVMIVNHKELFDSILYKFLIDNLVNASLITEEDKIVYDLTFDFK